MKNLGIYLCLGAFIMSLGLVPGCTRAEASAGYSSSRQPSIEEADLPDGTCEYHGRYLMTKNGDPMIILENEGVVELFVQPEDEHLYISLNNGDEITVQLGPIRETSPAQADVFGMELLRKGSIKDIDQNTLDYLEERGWIVQEKQQLLYVENRLYTGTGRPAAPACGTSDGHVDEVLPPEGIPGKNGQANFGSIGTGYIYLDEGAVAVPVEADGMENAYQLFLAEDTIDYHGRFFKKAELSQETIDWLEFYNGLPEEGQLSISMVPPELIDRQPTEDTAVVETK